MHRSDIKISVKCHLIFLLCVSVLSACVNDASDDVAALMKRIEQLEHEIGIQRDIEEIRRLQYAYNYYNSYGFEKQVLDLVAENAESIEIGGQGVYYGKEGFARNFGRYREGKITDQVYGFGFALVQLPGAEVITVAPDRQSANARVRVITPIVSGFPDTRFKMNTGDYEMGFIREDGKWKISRFKYVHIFAADFNPDGTVKAGYSSLPNGNEDAPSTGHHPFPESVPLPFHFANPVSGEPAPVVGDPRRYWEEVLAK